MARSVKLVGWWLRGEFNSRIAVRGEQRQDFCKGQKLPHALFLPSQSLWQRVRSLQPSYETNARTVWKLIGKRERKRIPLAVSFAQATIVAQADCGNAINCARSRVQPGESNGCVAETGMQCPASGW